ncbi:TPA: hypothetical protein I7730_00335 [Vibrio vulnificus]|uniref:Uncharacterized protein n=1 Tax=Vibrio vulnificus TaxID=672 RepID=A0A8H9MY34_VIBVL|nr:hypothetical protein [Vibrio vulnificus]HAS8538246.1 hypothetical protein [Vibrio vulnificus]
MNTQSKTDFDEINAFLQSQHKETDESRSEVAFFEELTKQIQDKFGDQIRVYKENSMAGRWQEPLFTFSDGKRITVICERPNYIYQVSFIDDANDSRRLMLPVKPEYVDFDNKTATFYGRDNISEYVSDCISSILNK